MAGLRRSEFRTRAGEPSMEERRYYTWKVKHFGAQQDRGLVLPADDLLSTRRGLDYCRIVSATCPIVRRAESVDDSVTFQSSRRRPQRYARASRIAVHVQPRASGQRRRANPGDSDISRMPGPRSPHDGPVATAHRIQLPDANGMRVSAGRVCPWLTPIAQGLHRSSASDGIVMAGRRSLQGWW